MTKRTGATMTIDEFRHIKKRDRLAIVGWAPHFRDAPFTDASFDIWSCNEVCLVHGLRADVHFNIHKRGEIEIPVYAERVAQLAKVEQPVFIVEPMPQLPNALIFPHTAIQDAFQGLCMPWQERIDLFSSSIAWKVAFGLALGYREIHIYGVDMACDSEYGFQRPHMLYWIGIAQGMGVKVFIPEISDLFHAAWLYGIDDPPETSERLQMFLHERIRRCGEDLQKMNQHALQMRLNMAKAEGVVAAYDEIRKYTKRLDRDNGIIHGPDLGIEDGPVEIDLSAKPAQNKTNGAVAPVPVGA